MTGQQKDLNERNNVPEETGEAGNTKPASGIGPSTKELLHLLRSMEGKATA